MANEQNLVRGGEAHKLTVEEQSMGGRASGEARRRRRDLRLALESLLESNVKVQQNGVTIKLSGTEAITRKLFERAMKGDVRAFKAIRETVGQDPVQKIEVAQTDPETVKAVEEMVYGDES